MFFVFLFFVGNVCRFIPRYFEKDLTNGKAALTPEGRKAVEEELAEDTEYCVEGLGEGQKLEP